MNHEDPTRQELGVLCALLVEGGLSARHKARLVELLKESEQARLFYKRYLEVHALLEWESGAATVQQDESDTLQDLLKMEQAAEAEIVAPLPMLQLKVRDDKTPWQISGAVHYLANRAAAWSAIAAVFAVALVLIVVLVSVNNTQAPIAIIPGDVTEPGPVGPADQTVATITAEHNARWAEGALAPGSELRPGTRLTLTAGFAEITTNHGAIAILEAPSTVELLDNDNAIQLHAGKLVGICETESSKGFLVRTPHMDITDLGTRFGVDATKHDATEVHVFGGSVEVARGALNDLRRQREVLTKGQAAQAESASDRLRLAKALPERFTQVLPGDLLVATGKQLADGEADRVWSVVAVAGQPVAQFGEMVVSKIHHGGVSDPNTSQWLVINEALNPSGKRQVVYTCKASFIIPASFDQKTSQLVIRCEADFSIKAVRVNGEPLKVPRNRIGDGWITLTKSDGVTTGQNMIEIDIHEFLYDDGRKNSSSLRVEVRAQPL